jgi:transcriptional accessory protein Tex/SPT6
VKEIGATNQPKRLTKSGKTLRLNHHGSIQNMKTKTTQTVINNLKSKIASKNLQLTDLYAEYYYKAAIKQTVDEKIGIEPNRDLLRYVEKK